MRLLREAPADRRVLFYGIQTRMRLEVSRIPPEAGLQVPADSAQSGLEQDRQIMAGAKGIPDGCRYDRFPAV